MWTNSSYQSYSQLEQQPPSWGYRRMVLCVKIESVFIDQIQVVVFFIFSLLRKLLLRTLNWHTTLMTATWEWNQNAFSLLVFSYGVRKEKTGEEKGILSGQRMYRISRLFGLFNRPLVTVATEDSSPALHASSVHVSSALPSLSPPRSKTAIDETQIEQTPHVPPRIRTSQTAESTQEKTQKPAQSDTKPAPARKVPQPPLEKSE